MKIICRVCGGKLYNKDDNSQEILITPCPVCIENAENKGYEDAERDCT